MVVSFNTDYTCYFIKDVFEYMFINFKLKYVKD